MQGRQTYVTVALVFNCLLVVTSAASILDLLSWDLLSEDTTEVEKRDESSAATPNQQNCICNGPSCMCCVDFNLTFIDLGGPGCVQMKYISQEEGIAVNVSYGESLLHSETVKGPNPEATCMSLLVDLAQVCARFSDLYPTDDGLRGCLTLEPKLLGEVQTQFNIGCFTMGSDGMKLDTVTVTDTDTDKDTTVVAGNTSDTTPQTAGAEEVNEEELIAAVNESAAEGLAFFGNLLGLSFGKPNQTQTEPSEDPEQPSISEAEAEAAGVVPLPEDEQSQSARGLVSASVYDANVIPNVI